MHDSIIEKLMTPKAEGQNPPGMKHNLKPRDIAHLGKYAQVWAVHLFGTLPKLPGVTVRALELQSVALYRLDGDTPQEIYLTAQDFPSSPSTAKGVYTLGDLHAKKKKPGSVFFGLSVADFVDTIYKHLPHVTKKTTVRLVAFGTAEHYGPLNLHDLDKRITLDPSSGGNFALGFVDKSKNQSLSFIELANFFPEQDLSEVARRFFMAPGQKQLDTSKGLFSGKLRDAEISFIPRPQQPQQEREKTKAYTLEQARLTWAIFADLRRVMLETFKVDPAVYRTPANCAARAYAAQYLPARIEGRSYSIRQQAMRSYWGGRMELFLRGNAQAQKGQKISVYDAVSLYPQSCINLGSLPTAESWYRLNAENLPTCHAGICTVEFEFPRDELFPCLPVQAGGHTFYPLAGESHCTIHELRYAVELGATIKKMSGWVYDLEGGDTSLAAFSRDLLEKKNQADKSGDYAARTMFKLLMNSLYGKFGQKYTGSYSLDTLRGICRDYDIPSVQDLLEIGNWEKMILEEGGEILPEENSTGDYWHPEWVALINGYGRFIESKALHGDYLPLAGTTDSVVMLHADDLPEAFDVEGVTFKREISGDEFTGVRARFYVLRSAGEVVKAALLGAPNMEGVAEKIAAWGVDWKQKKGKKKKAAPSTKKQQADTDEEIKIFAPRVEQVREGILSGAVIGKHEQEKWVISVRPDTGRNYLGDYSEPLPGVLDLLTDEEKALSQIKDFRGQA